MKPQLNSFTDDELVEIYSDLIIELKSRQMIDSNNVVAGLGENVAISHYRRTSGLDNLQKTQIGTMHYDATGKSGKRYSIKSTTGTTTGSFRHLLEPGNPNIQDKVFDYLIIVKFTKNFTVESIIEIPWEAFLLHKRWLKNQNVYYLHVNKTLAKSGRVIL